MLQYEKQFLQALTNDRKWVFVC